MKKTFSLLVCMIVCLAASQALAAYDFTGKTNGQMLNDMKGWNVAQWEENIRALLDTGDVSLIRRGIAVAQNVLSNSKVPGVDLSLLSKILGDNSALIGDRLASGGSTSAQLAGGDDALNLRTPDASRTADDFVKRNPGKENEYNIEGEESSSSTPYVPPIKPISPNSNK